MRPPNAKNLRRWSVPAIIADLSAAVLVSLATFVMYHGPIRFRFAGLRVSVRSPWWLDFTAVLLLALRHWCVPYRPSFDPSFAPDPPPVPPSGRFLAGALFLLTLLTAVGTYPQILHMRDGIIDVGDPLLNTWALSWVAHQMRIAPAHLFDGNIFYPEGSTLAFSDVLLVPAFTVTPLLWAGIGPVLAYNIVFLSAMILSGLGAALLVHELTGEPGAAIVAGIIFALLPFRMDHYPHLQLQQTQWIPLTMWALHRTFRSGRLVDAAAVGAFAGCEMLSSSYFGIFLVPYVAAVALVLLAADIRVVGTDQGVLLTCDRPLMTRRLLGLAVAGAVCLCLAAPAARAYLAARKVVGERSAGEVASGSATWRNYLSAPESNVIYGRWSRRYGSVERRLFPGIVALGLAVVALWPPLSKVRLAYGVALLFAFDMSLGFNGLSYQWLWDHVLPFRALRIPARMGLMVGFTLAVLAGHGVARLSVVARSKPRRWALAFALSLLILAEYRSRPLELSTISEVAPAIYADLLRDRGDGPDVAIVELPIAREDPTYMYYSTFHWQYLLNGYSGFFPPSYDRLVIQLRSFPDAVSLDALRSRAARYVVIHGELFSPAEYASIVSAADGSRGLTLVARRPWEGREMSLYRIAAVPQ
jgi:hypothetical protein